MTGKNKFVKSIFIIVLILSMNLLSFDLNLLKVLDALLRDASTTRAGERIGLSQPAVSAALGRLRVAFGDPLFVREGQALRPTEYALSLVAPLQHLLEDTNHLLARPAFDPSTATDLFRISAADFFTEMLLPDLTARLERDAPGVRLRWLFCPSRQLRPGWNPSHSSVPTFASWRAAAIRRWPVTE
jgi:DNA-binding transcriptional LysR family regulator